MSGVENNKDYKKQKSLTKNGSLHRVTSIVTKPARSPRFKLKKKPSLDSNQQPADTQRSDLLCSMDTSDVDTKEEKTISARPSKTIVSVPAPEAPPTHFIPVTIEGVWSNFLNYTLVSRNMVITKVGLSLMDRLMPGDQISSINGVQQWSREGLIEYVKSVTLEGNKKMIMTMVVIRVWNMNCLTKEQVDKLVAPREEHLHYFAVKVYGHTKHEKGWKLVYTKNRVLVQHIHADTPISSVLMIGDQILGVNDTVFSTKSKRNPKLQALDAIKKSVDQRGFAEIIGCRLVGARSSPAPSIEAEMAKKYPEYAVGVAKGKEAKKRSEKAIVPLEADVLEIAFRELSFLKQWETKDENGNVEFEVPICNRGDSLFKVDDGATPPPTNPLTRASSGTAINEKPEKTGGSLYLPLTPSAAPIAATPRKRKLFKKQDPESTIAFAVESNETSKITSDIPEEEELKKCDAKSGIVAYIKNKWGK